MRPRSWLLIPLLVLLVAPAAAHASAKDLIADCTNDSVINGTYSTKDYRDALANLPTDVDEYSDCRDVIRRAYLANAGRGGTSGGGSGSSGTGGGTAGGGTGGGTTSAAGVSASGSGPSAATGDSAAAAPGADPLATATPQERAAYDAAVTAGATPVRLDGAPVTPGTLGGASLDGLDDVPAPLLAVLALLTAGALGAMGLGARRLVVRRRPT